MRRSAAVALTIVAAVIVAVVVLVAVAAPSGSVSTDEDGVHSLEIAMLTVPVADTEPIIEIPDQFVGVPHPPPLFDTTDLGLDLTLRQKPDDLEPLDSDEVLRAIYLGHDTNGGAYYVWQTGSPNFRQLLGQIVADFGSFGRLGSSYGTLATGGGLFDSSMEESIAQIGMPTGSLSSGTGQPAILVAEWHGLPDEVAAVVFYQDGEPLGWQTPVSGTVALRKVYDEQDIQTFGHSIEMVALTADGDEWNRGVLFG